MYKTNHKKLLIDLFENNQDVSFSATYLVDNLKDSMNKATVYRQLKSLEEEKLIRKTYNSEVNNYEYQYYSDCENHLHLKCEKCGKIIHLKCSDANIFMSHVFDNHGFTVNQMTTTIMGLCKECNGLC